MAEAPAAAPRTRWTHVTRTVVLAVTLGALLLGGAGLSLVFSDAGATTAVQAAGCGSSSPHLTVQGTGQASAAPDVLTAVFSFTTTAGSSSAALAADNTQVNQALAALTADGVARRDVQTTGLSLQAEYAYPKGVPVLTGYQVTNTVSATIRSTSTAGKAVDDVVNASGDAAQITSLTFSFGDPARVEDEARSDAVQQAVAHAAAMAAAAGRRLGPVCSLTDNTQPSLFPQSPAFGADAAATQRQATPVPLEPGTQVQTDQVTMVYALERR